MPPDVLNLAAYLKIAAGENKRSLTRGRARLQEY
jgi:hypothetical protein